MESKYGIIENRGLIDVGINPINTKTKLKRFTLRVVHPYLLLTLTTSDPISLLRGFVSGIDTPINSYSCQIINVVINIFCLSIIKDCYPSVCLEPDCNKGVS